MNPTAVINALQDAFAMEIANPCLYTHNAIIINFPNHTSAIIMAQPVSLNSPWRKQIKIPKISKHTFHYVHRHDYGYGQTPAVTDLNKLTLHSVDDCRSYLHDACQTFFDAKFRDFELIFPTGARYLVTIADYQQA